MRRRWTEDDLAVLRSSWEAMAPRAIGERLGRTADAIECKARELGLRGGNRADPHRPGPRPAPAPEPSAAEARVPGIADWLREWRSVRRRQRARGPLRAAPDLEGAMAFRVSLGAFRADQ